MRRTLLALVLLVTACNECTRGEIPSCTCADGRRGMQRCTEQGTFTACICTLAVDASADAADAAGD